MQSIQIAVSEIWVTLIFIGILIIFHKDMKGKETTRALLIACIVRLLSDAASWGFDGLPGDFFGAVTRASNFLTFATNNVISIVFSIFIWELIKQDDEKTPIILKIYWGLEVISITALIINVRYNYIYTIDENNVYSRGYFYHLTYVTPVIALVVVLWMLIAYHRRFSSNQRGLAWTYLVIMSFATVYEFSEFGFSFQTYAQTLSALIAFFVGEIEIRRSLEKTKENLARAYEELEKSKIAAEDANKAKSDFLFAMSHDIRTPMNAIIGFRNLLEKHQDDPEKRKDYLEKIESSSEVLLSIINNVLELARIESGTIEIYETLGTVDQFEYDINSIFKELMDEKGIEFEFKMDAIHNYVYGDANKLRDIAMNLLSNAYKYTNPGGKVTVSISEKSYGTDGYADYEMVVSDTGIGMDESFLPYVFDEFARERTVTESKVEGTGLGMPIVKRLVDLMGGNISVESRKGVGSTFTAHVPLRVAEETDIVAFEEKPVNPDQFIGKRILLAEDNDLNAEIACEILTEVGFIVERATNGQECVDMMNSLEADYYDLILMDIQMPVMNGYDATDEIRSFKDKQKANITIIAMTANAFEEDKRNALAHGMNGHLSKPIIVNELFKKLSSIIESR